MAGRRGQVLDAAVQVLGTDGLGRVTYQQVDARAGVPAGTASNHFRNREALLTGIVQHVADLDRAAWDAFAAGARITGSTELAEALLSYLRHAAGPDRARTLARYRLFLEAALRPDLRATLVDTRAEIVRWAGEQLARSGTPQPDERIRTLLDCVDGLLLHLVTVPDAPDPGPAVRDLTAGLLNAADPANAAGPEPGSS
ncbi:TetR family transcriptional regulator [Saccharopolyspora sp. HNM0983]|uniref:TetR family transcriptional regulator n=1 Tax=Saccharopolyspora montiporae TaxID=2781240 RepID=A0A929B7E9_9PSEU|nr:TetR/AcrR family transcriptional regulator [Saccharopolyspora sp. HNM0983]MBE9372973.1 TetR family transcriptional regulator [Saccharopolyspora sp. HNM0983]